MFQAIKDKKKTLTVILSSMIFLLAAHLFRWTNTMFNHDALLVYQWDDGWQISLGRVLVPFYAKIRGQLTAPWLIALYACVFLIASVWLCTYLFQIRKQLHLILIAGIMTTWETVTFLNASFLPWLDVQMLTLLISVTVAFFLLEKKPRGFCYPIAGILCVCMMCLYQAYIEVILTILILRSLQDILHGQEPLAVLKRGIAAVLTLLVSCGLYYGIIRIVWNMTAIQPSQDYNSITRLNTLTQMPIGNLIYRTWRKTFLYFLKPFSVHPKTAIIIYMFLACSVLFAIFWTVRKRKISVWGTIIICFLLLILPGACDAVFFLTGGVKHALMSYAFSFLVIFAVVMDDEMAQADFPDKAKRGIRRFIIPTLCMLLILDHVTFANQQYLKQELQSQATLSVMTRIVDRMEQEEGYEAGKTEVVILGSLDHNPMTWQRRGMDHLTDEWSHLVHSYSVTYYETYGAYLENILGYPIDLVPQGEIFEHLTSEQAEQMPVFPQKGSVAMIGDVLVIRLSEDLAPAK